MSRMPGKRAMKSRLDAFDSTFRSHHAPRPMTAPESYNDGPLIIPDVVVERLERYLQPRVVRLWLNRPVPAFGGQTPMDYVRHGHSWNEVTDALERWLGENLG